MITAILLLALMQPQDPGLAARCCAGYNYACGTDGEAHAG